MTRPTATEETKTVGGHEFLIRYDNRADEDWAWNANGVRGETALQQRYETPGMRSIAMHSSGVLIGCGMAWPAVQESWPVPLLPGCVEICMTMPRLPAELEPLRPIARHHGGAYLYRDTFPDAPRVMGRVKKLDTRAIASMAASKWNLTPEFEDDNYLFGYQSREFLIASNYFEDYVE